MTTPEGKVKAKLNAALETIPRLWRFMPVQTGYGAPALDYILCANGWFVSIETKVPGKDLTPLQKKTRRDMEAAGGLVLVVKDDESVTAAVTALQKLVEKPL